jgi:hypothetical protein
MPSPSPRRRSPSSCASLGFRAPRRRFRLRDCREYSNFCDRARKALTHAGYTEVDASSSMTPGTDANGNITMTKQSHAGVDIALVYRAAPGTPYTITAAFQLPGATNNATGPYCGMGFRSLLAAASLASLSLGRACPCPWLPKCARWELPRPTLVTSLGEFRKTSINSHRSHTPGDNGAPLLGDLFWCRGER